MLARWKMPNLVITDDSDSDPHKTTLAEAQIVMPAPPVATNSYNVGSNSGTRTMS